MKSLAMYRDVVPALLRTMAIVGLVAGTSACAPLPPGALELPVGSLNLVLPAVGWQDIGLSEESVPFVSAPGVLPLQSRAAVLRGDDQKALAVMLVQAHKVRDMRSSTSWSGGCSSQLGLWTRDFAKASPLRIDCLQFKRWANNNEHWMEINHPGLVGWMEDQRIGISQPYAHVNYLVAGDGGTYIEVNAMVDLRLLALKTGNSPDYLRAAMPARAWSEQLAEATRLSLGLLNGRLILPDFPVALP